MKIAEEEDKEEDVFMSEGEEEKSHEKVLTFKKTSIK